MTDPDPTASAGLVPAPNPIHVQAVAALLRAVIQFAAGAGFTWGALVTGDQVTMAATALVTIGTIAWSLWQKRRSATHLRQAALVSAVRSAEASAAAGAPVVLPVVKPPGA